MRTALQELPSDLHQTYERILINFRLPEVSVKRVRRLFQCIASAGRPLFLSEVMSILSVNIDTLVPANPKITMDKSVPVSGSSSNSTGNQNGDAEGIIRAICPALIDVVSEKGLKKVQFIHASARDYLLSVELKQAVSPVCLYSFDEYSANLTLARLCLLSLAAYTKLFDCPSDILGFGAYARKYWDYHMSADNESDLEDLLSTCHYEGSPVFAWCSESMPRQAVRLNLWQHHVRRLLDHMSPPRDQTLVGLFYYAASIGQLEVARVLLRYAAGEGSDDAVLLCRTLDKRPSDFRFYYSTRQTALHKAASEGHMDIIRLILAHDSTLVAVEDDEGNTPLHVAALADHVDAVRFLLEYTVTEQPSACLQVRARNKRGQTTLHCLLDPLQPSSPIDRSRVMKSWYNDYPDAPVDTNSQTAWHRLTGYKLEIRRERLEIIRMLLDHCALVDAIDENGDTPLHAAASLAGGHIVFPLLLKSPAADGHNAIASRCRARKRNGQTLLHCVADYMEPGEKKDEIVRLLLDNGALVDAVDENGDTPLHAAASWYCPNVVRLLLEHSVVDGFNIALRCRARNRYGRTALHRAAAYGQADTCDVLLQYGALIEDVDNDGKTAFHTHIDPPERFLHFSGDTETIRTFLEHRARAGSSLPLEPVLRTRLRRAAQTSARHGDQEWHEILEDFASQLILTEEESRGVSSDGVSEESFDFE